MTSWLLHTKTEDNFRSETISELTTENTRESDPSVLARDFNGNLQDLSSISTIIEPDFGEINFDKTNELPEINLEEVNPIELPTEDSKFSISEDDLKNFEIKF